jgi:hypothetical protein
MSELAICTDGRHRILKRRLAWLIGSWVTAEEESAKFPIVWQILVHLLSERGESTDRAVQLSTAVAVKECVDVSVYPWVKLREAMGIGHRLLLTLHTADY